MDAVAEAKKEVKASSDKRTLVEIMQNNRTQFALCRYDSEKDMIIQCHQFVHCRDFMNEVFVGMEENKDMHIYGFAYTKDNPRPDMDNTSILLKMPDAGTLKNFQENFPLLKGIEEFMGWGVSYAELVKYPGQEAVVWVIGDKKWQQAAIAFSLYTYILKCLTYPFQDKNQWKEEIAATTQKYGDPTVEAGYMDPAYMNWLFEHLGDIISKYKNFSGWTHQKTAPTHLIHDDSGFVSLKKIIFGPEKTSIVYSKHVLYDYNPEK